MSCRTCGRPRYQTEVEDTTLKGECAPCVRRVIDGLMHRLHRGALAHVAIVPDHARGDRLYQAIDLAVEDALYAQTR